MKSISDADRAGRLKIAWSLGCGALSAVGLLLVLLVVQGCNEEKPGAVATAESAEDFAVIQRVQPPSEFRQIPYYGDIWVTTWADDGHLYSIFGDGTGMKDRLPTLLVGEPDEFDAAYEEVRPGWFKVKDPRGAAAEWCEIYDCSKAYRQAPYTPAGMVRLEGLVPDFKLHDGEDQDIVSRHIPYGDRTAFEQMDKPSSLVAVGPRFYAHMHYPPGEPVCGYLAWSDDHGKTWHRKDGSPWKATSPFRVTMFFNMGQAYCENRDRYLYGLGIGREVALEDPRPQKVYLLRVPLDRSHASSESGVTEGAGGSSRLLYADRAPKASDDPVLDYSAYEYFAGFDAHGRPRWSAKAEEAEPLEGLATKAQGSALYHPGLKRYLFLSGYLESVQLRKGGAVPGGTAIGEVPAAALFESPHPWGPWRLADRFPGGYIASFVPKGAGPNSVYFAAAGGGGLTYALNIGRLELETRPPRVVPAAWRKIRTRKVEQVIGDVDFETMRPTRQRTQSQVDLLHSDLGASFEHDGKLWFLFGDSDPESPGWDEYHDDAVAWTTARSIEEFRLHFLKDADSGRGYLNPKIRGTVDGSDPKLDVDLGTLNVPLDGLSDGESVYVWFTTGGAQRSLVARSDDTFRTFKKVFDFGNTHFVDVAVERARGPIPGIPESKRGPWVWVFGSGNAEHREVYLAALPLDGLRRADRSSVRFLKRATPAGPQWKLEWSDRESEATPIFRIEHGAGPGVMSAVPHGWGFGEPLIHYNRELKSWVATYNSARRTIRLRTASRPWGPWSESIVLFDPAEDDGRGPAYGRYIGDDRTERLGGQGELYGPYVIERFTRTLPDGRVKIYWLLSPWQPYTVLLMESVLEKTP